MSQNGNSSKCFHDFCDNKGPTLSIIKSKNNNIFGGFTPLNWDLKKKDSKDNSSTTFLFSLKSKRKYDLIKMNEFAIHSYVDKGPYFGSSDLVLNKDMRTGKTFANQNCNFLSNHNLITGGIADNEDFDVEELEVYRVIY